jgi:hypothetical protein
VLVSFYFYLATINYKKHPYEKECPSILPEQGDTPYHAE